MSTEAQCQRASERKSKIFVFAFFVLIFFFFTFLMSSPVSAQSFSTNTAVSTSSHLTSTPVPGGGGGCLIDCTAVPTPTQCIEPTDIGGGGGGGDTPTAIDTLDIPTLDVTPDATEDLGTPGIGTGTPGTPISCPTSDGATPCATPEFKIVPSSPDDIGHTLSDGSLEASYSQHGYPQFSTSSWYKVVNGDGSQLHFETGVRVYYHIEMSAGYGLFAEPIPPCQVDGIGRYNTAGGYYRLYSVGAVFDLGFLGSPYINHCVPTFSYSDVLSQTEEGEFQFIHLGGEHHFQFSYYISNGRPSDGYVDVFGTAHFSLLPLTPTPTPTEGTPVPPSEPTPGVCQPPPVCEVDCIILDPPDLHDGECYTVVPGGTLYLPVIPGLPGELSLSGFQVCTQYLSFHAEFMGFDVDTWLTMLCGLTAISIIYRELKS